MSRRNKKYYAVAGVNAYGVYTDYDKVLETRVYIVQYSVKRFSDYEEAKDWAEDTYWSLQGYFTGEYKIKEIKKINWCYYRKAANKKKTKR